MTNVVKHILNTNSSLRREDTDLLRDTAFVMTEARCHMMRQHGCQEIA